MLTPAEEVELTELRAEAAAEAEHRYALAVIDAAEGAEFDNSVVIAICDAAKKTTSDFVRDAKEWAELAEKTRKN